MEKVEKLDILAIVAHPDDAELCAGGTLIKMCRMGKRVGIVDLTKGDLGSRGTPEIRMKEAAAASEILGIVARDNLGYRDGFFRNDEEHQKGVIRMIRRFQPEILIANSLADRHPDHARAAQLVKESAFYSGLRMIKTEWKGEVQEHWRPKKIFHFIQDQYLEPDFVVDITEHFEDKLKAMRAYGTQFFNPNDKSDDPVTHISSQHFWDFMDARARTMGHKIGVTYGEGFQCEGSIRVNDLMDQL
jgi:bacillithiol biosynthesis deacetylase BshB1